MALNTPSLSELLNAYNTPGLGAAINAGNQGVQTGLDIAAKRQKAQLDQQNALANQGIAQQTANAATTDAAARTQDAQSKFVPAEVAEQYLGLPAGSLGKPGSTVPRDFVQDLINKASAERVADANRVQSAQTHSDAQALIAQNATIAAQTHKDATQAAAQGKADTNLNVANSNFEKLPWYTNVLHSIGHNTEGYNAAQNALSHAQSEAGAAPKSVLGASTQAAGPHGPTVKQNGIVYTWNPATKNYE